MTRGSNEVVSARKVTGVFGAREVLSRVIEGFFFLGALGDLERVLSDR